MRVVRWVGKKRFNVKKKEEEEVMRLLKKSSDEIKTSNSSGNIGLKQRRKSRTALRN